MNIYIFAYVEAQVCLPSNEWKNKEIMYWELIRSLLFFVEFSDLIEVAFLRWNISKRLSDSRRGHCYPHLLPSKGFVLFSILVSLLVIKQAFGSSVLSVCAVCPSKVAEHEKPISEGNSNNIDRLDWHKTSLCLSPPLNS